MPEHSDTTFVKGADGFLYRLSRTGPLQRVPDDQAQQFLDALPAIQQALEALFAQQIMNVAASCNQKIEIVVPEVDI